MKDCVKQKNGFILLELAIAIAVMGVILSLSLTVLRKQINVGKDDINKSIVEQVDLALKDYFAAHQRLPCPANPTLPINDPSFGREAVDSSGVGCAADLYPLNSSMPRGFVNQDFGSYLGGIRYQYFLFGTIPTRSLGLPDKLLFDAYNNRITYVVLESIANYRHHPAARYTNILGYTKATLKRGNGNVSGVVYSSQSACNIDEFYGLFGDVNQSNAVDRDRVVFTSCNAQVRSNINNQVIDASKDQLAYVIISHGENGYGAWNYSGQINASSPNQYENYNSYGFYITNGTVNSNYFFDSSGVSSQPLVFYQGMKTTTFDDVLMWSNIQTLLTHSRLTTGLYCHPSTNSLVKNANSAILTDSNNQQVVVEALKYGQTFNYNNTTNICQTMGNWM